MADPLQKEWKGMTRGGSFGYRFFILLIRFAGVRGAYTFLFLVVPYFIPFAPKATRAIWLYGRDILHYTCWQRIRLVIRNYYSLGQVLIDKVAVNSGKKDSYSFVFDDTYSRFLEILDQPQGVIMIGAHTGNWEIGAPFFDSYGKKMNIVMYDAEYRKIKDLLEQEMESRNYKVIPLGEDSLAYMLAIKNALDKQEYVCFQGDRYLPGSQVLQAEFMGRKAYFPAGPYLLASRLGVPVVFYFAMREKGMRYSFQFTPAVPVKRTKENKPEMELLRQYIATLERVVRNYPEQWFNYYNFWKE